MKILHLAESYWPERCGVQEAMQRLSEGLAARGHDVTVGTGFHPARQVGLHNGVKIEQFNVAGKWTTGYTGEIRRWQDFVQGFRPDVTLNYAAQQWSADLVFPILDRMRGAKIFLPCGYPSLGDWKWWLYYRRLPQVLRRYDHLIYLSRVNRDFEFGRRHGLSSFSIIGNGADQKEFSGPTGDFRRRFAIDSPLMLLSVGNFSADKGQQRVLDAFIRCGRLDATLVFIGSTPSAWMRGLQREADRRRPGRVRVLSGLPRREVVDAFQAADLFLSGSAAECFPIVLLEAMASATPYISTDAGCARELTGGMIVKGAAEMAQAINRLADDETARRRLAVAGQSVWREQYTWSTVIDEYERLYRQLVREREEGRPRELERSS